MTSNEQNPVRDKNGLTEEEFLKQYDPGKYTKPALTADTCIFRGGEILLIRRGGHPCLGQWALPGGFAEPGEELWQTSCREVMEETGIAIDRPSLVGVYSKPGRDPRDWVVTVAYQTDVTGQGILAKAGDDAREACWFEILEDLRTGAYKFLCGEILLEEADLAFDHYEIISDAIPWK